MSDNEWSETAKKLSKNLNGMLKRRGFYWPSFEIYGGARGFYDYGPLGAMLKTNVENIWRRFYIMGEGFAEISTPAITPEEVFRASGHLEKFSDVLVSCQKCGESFRADHLLEDIGVDATSLSIEEVGLKIKDLDVKCPLCGGDLGEVEEFNLMFPTTVGAGQGKRAYLRPETAQAMFINFPVLYRYFREKLPFGVAQIGRGYRNEISPRQGLLRQREFNMAEVEVFVDPEKGGHPGFSRVSGDEITLVPSSGGVLETTVGSAVEKGVIKNPALAYYVALTQRFLLEVGIHRDKLRFRQHHQEEMAHYASDCWDAEALTSYGWVEIVGIADRTCFDLERHMEFSGTDMRASADLDNPYEETVKKVTIDMKKVGPRYRGDTRRIAEHLNGGGEYEEVEGGIKVVLDGKEYIINDGEYTIYEEKVLVRKRKFIPHVIEPSYGIDRIIYSIIEQNYIEEEGDGETLRKLTLPPTVAPFKAGVFPLMARDGLDVKARELADTLAREGIPVHYDESGSIGRRYARMDEIGTPYCLTVDYQSLEDNTCTIRYRDTKEQERIPIDTAAEVIRDMIRDHERTI